MKEATGELNFTLVVLLSIGVLSAFFFTVLWPTIKSSFIANSKCRDAVCDKKTLDSNNMVTCHYYKDGEIVGSEFKCIWKG